jgi:hypothetical protein
MFTPMKRKRVLLLAAGLLAIGTGVGVYSKLSRDLRKALGEPVRIARPLQFIGLKPPLLQLERWGGGEVEGVAVTATSLISAGKFGVADETGELSGSLPGLHASALTLWRGHPLVALAAGGIFLRRAQAWEELRSGFGTLHVRTLVETPGGELLIGAREGLYRAAWGAKELERLDSLPVRSIALGEGGVLLAGGEEGLQLHSGNQITPVATPDPWVDWVGLIGREMQVLTPKGLARGPLEGALEPLAGGEDLTSAAQLDHRIFGIAEGRLLRIEASGRAAEEIVPAVPRRVFAVSGLLFVDTATGLYRRTPTGWVLARPRPKSLPPGPCHVNALAFHDSQLVVGIFNGGLAVAERNGPARTWWTVPGSTAWGVNALLSAGGRLHVASLRGASQFDGKKLVPLAGSEAGAAFSLATTRDGVAIGYGQGVMVPGTRFLSAFHGLPGNQALALAAGESLFVGTPSGLGAVQGSRVAWRVAAGEGKLPHPWVTALALRGDDLFIGTYGGGVTRRSPQPEGALSGTFESFPETEGLKVNPGCLVEGEGRLYLGTDGQGLFRLSPDGKRFVRLKLPLPSLHVTAILSGPEGLFIGTDEGLVRVPMPLEEDA